MGLAILLGANPQSYNLNTATLVRKGKWKIVGVGVRNSVIKIFNSHNTYALGDEFETTEDLTELFAEFTYRGDEYSVSVFLEELRC